MWTDDNRRDYDRKGQGYPSDLTDEEWAIVEPLLPPERKVSRRLLLDTVLYVLKTGCQWDMIPKDLAKKSTAHDYFVELQVEGVLARIHAALYTKCRELAGRAPSPTVAIADSQSVKSAEKGGNALIRWDMTQARKLRARNGMRRSTRSG